MHSSQVLLRPDACNDIYNTFGVKTFLTDGARQPNNCPLSNVVEAPVIGVCVSQMVFTKYS